MKPRLLIFIVAYHAERTLEQVIRRIPASLASDYDVEILVIDDSSADATFDHGVRTSLDASIPFKTTVLFNPENQGYGGNQKIGYHYAIRMGFDYVALLHGDGQYAPEMLPALVEPLRLDMADAVLGSRMMTPADAVRGGMPIYKLVGNRILTTIQNRVLGMRLTEFHSGYRVYSVAALRSIPFERNANEFHFDTEIIIQLHLAGKRIVERSIPCYYGDEICRVNGLKYAKDVLKASLQAKFQKAHLFYDRRFDCAAPPEGTRYPSKLDFDSTHSRVVNMVPAGTRVLDLGSGIGAVGAALKAKGCHVVGCDIERGPSTAQFDRFVHVDLNEAFPDFGAEPFGCILCLDVIEHLKSPEDFLDRLRELAARSGAEVIVTTANVGFFLMRLSLLFGRFEYGKRGILDLTHTRLFTFATMRRAMRAAGFDIVAAEGVPLPLPFVFGPTLSSVLIRINQALCWLWPTLCGFQILLCARARPSLSTLLGEAERAAAEKLPQAMADADSRAA